ncbi:MAG: hypothetical protein IRY97_06100, partial [Thermomicrobiaceae bacterium]|nr:hypothetical protein [Thermomicrobiaceae bacterium]
GAPVELADLERVLTRAPALRERFRPHPTIAKAWLLLHGDTELTVTFDREVFDAHPDTVRLVSYGDRLLDDLLKLVDAPARSDGAVGVLCCGADDPLPVRAYYRPDGDQARRIDRLADLERALDGDLTWSPAARMAAEACFKGDLHELEGRGKELVRQRRDAERLLLEERARQLLLRAALIEIARRRRSDLLGQSLPWAFSEDAVRGLASHKYPFAPLLRLVDARGLVPSPDDPYYREIETATPESLTRRFTQLEKEAKELVQLLGKLGADTPARETEPPASPMTSTLLAPPTAEVCASSGLPAARAGTD